MDKCPYCEAETRPGDNFCLNCGNRLLPATPSSSHQQDQPATGDATLAASDEWNAGGTNGTPLSGASWGNVDQSAPTAIDSGISEPTVPEPAVTNVPTAQATLDRIAEPARFILRSDTGEILQEYPLDKPEIVIGRAPKSDILLSKDKLTSRRHSIVSYANNQYILRDEHSANGTFVNGQQLEEGTAYSLHDGDHIGIGEHELVFHAYGSNQASVEDLPTIAVTYDPADQSDMTYSTQAELPVAIPTTEDYSTFVGGDDAGNSQQVAQPEAESVPAATPLSAEPQIPIQSYASVPTVVEGATKEPENVNQEVSQPAGRVESAPQRPLAASSDFNAADDNITFNRFSSLSTPSLPDISPLMAALSSLDGQIMALQEKFNVTQEAMHSHEDEVMQTANQLRMGIRRVSDRMDNMIADVARNREALAWADLLQLMEDVMNNPRDIEYVTKLARKARELNKVFQIHQNVLNTMAECNSLLRSLIGEDR